MFLASACRSHNPICIAQLSSLFLPSHPFTLSRLDCFLTVSLSLFPLVFYLYNPERPPYYSTYLQAVRALLSCIQGKYWKPCLHLAVDELDMNIHSLVLPLCNTTVSPNIHKLCNSGLFSLPLGLSYTSLLHKSTSLNEATVDSEVVLQCYCPLKI